jgi:hydrocephalus-inducing protein
MKLMEDTVGFGTVVVNSKISKTIQFPISEISHLNSNGIQNSVENTLLSVLKKVILNAHEDILFDVTFHPNVVDNDIKFKVKCSVDGMDPLLLI